ncbi:MAG TPA: ATP synthase F1 subunit epsilon [Flavobacteriales bacterium]|jgi:F-type H+-transporting ATPase subunit epsilon|nr:ATP synthase F1 subunit epsilon [Flavobacteriales bacterium]|tara:strand:- start:51 stop:284 length:234 start_codon:yes stop_codon:yes gene_type:complete
MTVYILTPDATLFSGEATYVGLPGSDGSMGIMDRHAALITTLKAGEVLVRGAQGEETFAVKGGTVEVLNNVVTILAA